ncbi:E3 ubiquitin-protein ligase TRIM39-like [Lineus longissimus]|uniref:E3 ubiquitin-protein ligase TRIM39-like n=1 Tax=Lineus longissimus TaxID=88925 RepID=UPI002B4CCEFF
MENVDADLPLFVPIHPFIDFFTCPICMETFKNVTVTSCGHRFCQGCIRECVGRLHKCPCCNKRAGIENLFRDAQYSSLLDLFIQEKDKAEKKYFDGLITRDFADASDQDMAKLGVPNPQEKAFSPVELVLKKHLKQSLAAHEKYYQDLKKEFHKSEAKIRSDYQQKMEDLQRQSLLQDEFERQFADLQQTQERHIAKLHEELESCGKLVADAYDRYLGEHIPSLAVLPVKISVTVLCKNVSIPDVVLKPQQSTEDIKNIVESHFENKGDKVVNFGDISYIYFGPFSKRSLFEMNQIAEDLIVHGATHPDVIVLPEGSKPVLQFGVKPGSEVVLRGTVRCKSDMPKECFASSFKPGEPQTVDYFSCKDCGFNWVCRSCMEVCHKDHTVAPYIMQHQPTWACCYCPKKKKCVIQANTSN